MFATLLSAILICTTVSAVSFYGSRLRQRVKAGCDDESRPSTGSLPALSIVSGRARCECGHAFACHRSGEDSCGCNDFAYAGGLVIDPIAAGVSLSA